MVPEFSLFKTRCLRNNQRLESCAGGLGRFLYFIEIFSVLTTSHLRSTQPVFSSQFVRICPARERGFRTFGADLVLMSKTIFARSPSICFSTTAISFGSSSSKLQMIGSPVPFSSGTSLTRVSLIRSRITSSVSSGKSFDGEEADPLWLPSPCEEDGAQPNEQVSSKANPKNDESRNARRGKFRVKRINLIISGKNSSVRISFRLVARIANLHSADVQAREKEHNGGK